MFFFYVLSFFNKGDTIQGGTLFKGGHYLRKYGNQYLVLPKDPQNLFPYVGKAKRNSFRINCMKLQEIANFQKRFWIKDQCATRYPS